MSKRAMTALVLAMTAGAAWADGKSQGETIFGADKGSIRLKAESVSVHANSQSTDARVGADGRLWIGERAVELSDPAQAALRDYHRDVVALQKHAMAFGAAGAQFGLQTVGEVFAGLLTGKAEQAGARAQARGQAFKAEAKALCGRLDAIRTAQQAAADAAPAFAAYAVLTRKDIDDCLHDVEDDDSDDKTAPKS